MPTQRRFGQLLVLALAFLEGPALLRAADIPLAPAKEGVGFFIHDYAGLLDKVATERIQQAHKQAFEQARYAHHRGNDRHA